MIPYILHVALLISICLLFYKIFLQKETFYHLNRVILLICLVLSFALPLITIPEAWALRTPPEQVVAVQQPQQAPQIYPQVQVKIPVQQLPNQKPIVVAPQSVQTTPASAAPDKPIWPIALKWLFYLYWAGVAAFGLNLLLQVIVLLYRAYSNPVIRDGRFRIIEVQGDKAPCSFGNNIFINPEKYDWDTYNQILLHEKVHIQQRHSFDILLAELVLVFQWFNPFAWFYRGELENNLEFLTDEAVLGHNDVEKESYQLSLLKVSAPHLALSVTTNYNQSLLKKRIIMMNAKRSNIHTMWKYFILVPLMAGLACALNQTAFSQTKKATGSTTVHTKPVHHNWGSEDRTQGSWFATIKGEKVRMEFRNEGDEHNWSNSDDFKVSDFSAFPKDTKGDFTLKRDAGTILFNGKFDGDEGYGHYKFSADESFTEYLKGQGITTIDNNDRFTFFIVNLKRGYIEMLKANGYNHLSKDDLISMAALKVDEPYIKFWKELGYHLSSNDLVSGKALGIDKDYVEEIEKAGYKHLSFDQLVSFKAQGIDAKYISSLKRAKGNNGEANTLPKPDELSSYKALNVDSTYIRGLEEAGYHNLPMDQLTSLKAVGVTPEYVKSMASIGYKDLSANDLQSFKALGVTPEYVKTFSDAGYKNIPADQLTSLKALGIEPGFAKSFQALGYKDIQLEDLTSLKSLNVTPEYIRSFEAAGFKQIPLNELSSLKALNVTPGFIKGFKDIGFNNISLDEATSLKAVGVTPQYIQKMRAKGFNSKDLNRYIELKNAFN